MIPKLVCINFDENDNSIEFSCRNCNRELRDTYKFNFCPGCGQKLNWEPILNHVGIKKCVGGTIRLSGSAFSHYWNLSNKERFEYMTKLDEFLQEQEACQKG